VGGAANSRTGAGTLGFSASPSFASSTSTFLPTFFLTSANSTVPAYQQALGVASGNAPYNLYGPGNYDVDISSRRSFSLHVFGLIPDQLASGYVQRNQSHPVRGHRDNARQFELRGCWFASEHVAGYSAFGRIEF
jgi:hypothetical protein